MSRRHRVALALGLLLAACGEGATSAEVSPIAAPTRTAAQDRALRAMAMDVAEAQACEVLDGRFLPLPEDRRARPPGELPQVDGRLWVSECRVEREGERLTIHLGGRGWQWVDQARPGPLGSSFTVRGVVRFEGSFDLEAEVDLRYDEEARRALVALTPTTTPRARITPIGALPVSAEGGWSELVGGLGGLLGTSPEREARPMVEAEAAGILRRELARGMTLSLDLCSSQLDATLGALGDGDAPAAHPYPEDGRRWLDNARGRLHRGGLDLNGPFPGEGALEVDVDVESGSPVAALVVCGEEAARVASSFLAGAAAPTARAAASGRASPGSPAALRVEESACADPHVLLVPEGELAIYRLRVRREGDAARAMARCE